jgi:hypothetical protein
VAHFDFRSSPLLSTLGIAALAGTMTPVACRDEGNPQTIHDFSDVVDVFEEVYAFYCECYANLYYSEGGVEECLAQVEIFGEGEEACLKEVFDANPEAFEVVRCEAEAMQGLLSCKRAEGCPSPFTCGDGTMVSSYDVCDGYVDCEDGSDEQQNCPPPHTCADGEPIAPYSVCDGFPDCADESDEQGCPPPHQCGDGIELPASRVCDGYAECEDGSDEQQNCPQTCESRYSAQSEGCGEVSDEVDALFAVCYTFQCFDGTEISRAQECDGTADCPEGEDEGACPSPPPGEG